MSRSSWRQLVIDFADPDQAENVAVADLSPLMATTEQTRLISGWFFVRKRQWRLRYLPRDNKADARAHLLDRLDRLRRTGRITRVTENVYEPETHAFGGGKGMTAAHQLWHSDSRHLLAHLAATVHQPEFRRRREMSILLCSAMLRAADLDWYEQGDVWARVCEHRPPPTESNTLNLQISVRRLMSTNTDSLTRTGAALQATADWMAAFGATGRTLGSLHRDGQLHRGLRAVLAHHIIFAWNRHGIPSTDQALLATAAKITVFGPDPRTSPPATHPDTASPPPTAHDPIGGRR